MPLNKISTPFGKSKVVKGVIFIQFWYL